MQQLTNGTLLQGGKYKIERVLGQGGFGITYLAYQEMLDRQVCIKEFFFKDFCERNTDTSKVTLGTTSNKELVQRFMLKFAKEAKTISKLRHQNIISILDIFEENDTAYYVMEYIEGESLADMVKRLGKLDEQAAVDYIKKVADALSYIHERKINHLDVKPANVMVRKTDNEPVVIDFGLAKQYDAETGSQTSTTPVGISHGYAPIEQYRQGGVSEFSPQTDIYSLGATLYKLITGTTPPEASYLISDEEELVRDENISVSTWEVIQKAMAPARKKRIANVDEFVKMLLNKKQIERPQPISEETMLVGASMHTEQPDVDSDETVLVGYHASPSKKDIVTYNVKGIALRMIRIEHGTFEMGATQEQKTHYPDEVPVHSVTISKDFLMAEVPVTLNLWSAVMGSTPSNSLVINDTPVTEVSWFDAMEFISRLNDITGKNFRLPTEAEWEFSARGGNRSKGYQFSGGNDSEFVAWSSANSDSPKNVKCKPANELGLYDMSGNVWEWCNDWHEKYNCKSVVDPLGPDNGTLKVCRGGSFYNSGNMSRVAVRLSYSPMNKQKHVGFRLAL